MLDIKFIKENKDLIREAARKKHIKFDVERLLAVDEKRRSLIQEVDGLRKQHKEFTGSSDEARASKDRLSHKEFEFKAVEGEFDELMLQVPNVPDPSVPEGESDKDNVEVRRWLPPSSTLGVESQKTPSVFHGGKDYLTVMKEKDWVDLERGVKVSGFRGYFLKGDAALLSMALWKFALDFLAAKGFRPFLAPALVREENLVGTGHFPRSRDDVFKTQDDDLYLAGTAEIPMTGYHANEILSEAELPKKYAAFSTCFRREAGSYGKDQKGIFRLHEFYKVEQFILCKNDHQESVRWHEELTNNSEELLRALEIPYRVVVNSTGDIGQAHVKTYDIESWIPSENRYRETHSSSYYHDFQTRSLNIKYRDSAGALHFAHSLNNTAVATPRILEALLENHQQADGSIKIPEALQKYYGSQRLL